MGTHRPSGIVLLVAVLVAVALAQQCHGAPPLLQKSSFKSSSSTAQADVGRISLTGNSWSVENSNGSIQAPASVPGQIHLDLLRAGVIGDPYYRFNDAAQTWIAHDMWSFERTFHVDKTWYNEHRFIWLHAEGLDTAATVLINNRVMGTANNQHRDWLFDVRSAIVPDTDNIIEIFFLSPVDFAEAERGNYPYEVPYGDPMFDFKYRNFIRKCQSDFGWDWGPAFAPTGIWRNIELIGVKSAFLQQVTPLIEQSATDATMFHVNVRTFVYAGQAGSGSVIVNIDGVQKLGKSFPYSVGESEVDISFDVPRSSVELWWPNGFGKQALYNLTVTFLSDSGDQDSKSKRVGFRHVELVQNPLPDGEAGLSFYFRINDVPIFAKGSNWIPADAFESRVTTESLRRLLSFAVESNQNMVRNWGGGIYQRDEFYDLTDELGLMVWEEFMFACALYPRDEKFLNNVREEVTQQVRRLGSHASIVLWSGNNENQYEAQVDPMYLIDYSALYDGVVRRVLWVEDMTRPFWPSSPSNGALVDDPSRDMYIQRWGDAQSQLYGDVHRYNYVDLCTDVSKFPRPRFASEFGFQSYPSFETLKPISIPEDWDNDSPLMNHRQHHPNGNKELQDQMSRFFHLPNNTDTEKRFDDFIYLTQAVQAMCIKAESEHYRRIKNESHAYTMGALYWQLNDIWQAQSWASLEYGGRWKMLHYYVKRFFSPVIVSAYELDSNASVYVTSDVLVPLSMNVTISVLRWADGSVVSTTVIPLSWGAYDSKLIWSKPIRDLIGSLKRTDVMLDVTLQIANPPSGCPSSFDNQLFFSDFSSVQLPAAALAISNVVNVPGTNDFTLTATSNSMAPFVWLDTEVAGHFSDNGFFIRPNDQISLVFHAEEATTADALAKSIRIRSVRDTYLAH